jgi:RNA polymerase sigma factor (sigma-70 family)
MACPSNEDLMADNSTGVLQGCIDAVNAGQAGARDRLLAHTQGRLLLAARGLLHGRFGRLQAFEQTGDVVNELNLRLLENWERIWQGNGSVTTLVEYFRRVSRVMRDVLSDMLRKVCGHDYDRPHPVPLDESAGSGDEEAGGRCDPATDTLDPRQLAIWGEFHQKVEKLPPKLRDAIDLLWYQGLPQAEAAALLGLPLPTLKHHWMKARLQLQADLEGSPFDWSVFKDPK